MKIEQFKQKNFTKVVRRISIVMVHQINQSCKNTYIKLLKIVNFFVSDFLTNIFKFEIYSKFLKFLKVTAEIIVCDSFILFMGWLVERMGILVKIKKKNWERLKT